MFLVPAAAEREDATDAGRLSAGYGLVLDDWQQYVIDCWLGRRRDGQWASPRCGLSVPRQNGKNALLEVRELFGMIMLGEKFLHTAHEVKTARKAFARLLGFFDNPREYPELSELVTEVRRTNGQEAIYLANGGSVEFIARSKGSGRGFTVDVLVMDEAQELSDDTLAALLPTISAAPQGNPQMILTGTPPSPSMNGEVFTRMRVAAVEGKDKRQCWLEWSATGVDDIAPANPALGTRLGLETIEDERAAMDEVTFGRERGGMWDEVTDTAGAAIDPAGWLETCDPRSAAATVVAFGVAVSLDRSWSAIGVAGLGAGGTPHLEVVNDGHKRGTAWLVPRCRAIEDNNPGSVFVVDGGGPAVSLIEPLQNEGLDVRVLATRDIGAAAAWLTDAVSERAMTHGPQPELDAAVAGAKARNIGDGMFAFGRRASSVDISPLEAVTVAASQLPADYDPLNSIY